MKKNKKIFALGFFDGVHLGHQALLEQCAALARQTGAEAAAITFDAHPQSLFLPQVPALISTVKDRDRLLRHYGIEYVHPLPVREAVMSMPWQDFLAMLMEHGAAGFVCGYDFRFGHRGEGTAEKLKEFCEGKKMPCVIVPEQKLEGLRISSTYIREQLETGDMATAVRFLGHPYLLTGRVVYGHQLGRRLGIPTANLLLPEGVAVPKFGVYACACIVDGQRYPAVTNIGTRPTVGGENVTVESWIQDFEGDLYDREITLEFYYFIRPERKFPDLTALQREIRANAAETRAYLSEGGYL